MIRIIVKRCSCAKNCTACIGTYNLSKTWLGGGRDWFPQPPGSSAEYNVNYYPSYCLIQYKNTARELKYLTKICLTIIHNKQHSFDVIVVPHETSTLFASNPNSLLHTSASTH